MRKTPEDAEKTRQAILDAAELLFFENGVENTTLEKISRAAGVTRGASYWHFKDKKDILHALHERSISPQAAVVRAIGESNIDDPLGALEASAREVLVDFEKDERHQKMLQILASIPRKSEEACWLREANDDLFGILIKVAERARKVGDLSPNLEPEEAAYAIMVTMNGILTEWLRHDRAFDLQKIGGMLIGSTIGSLRIQN